MSRIQDNDLQAAGRRITFGRTPESLESINVEAPQEEQTRQARQAPPPPVEQRERRRPQLPETGWSPRSALHSRQQVRRAIILNELLGKPKGLHRPGEFDDF